MRFFSTPEEKIQKKLFKAVRNDDLEAMKEAVAGGANVNLHENNLNTPLFVAVSRKFRDGVFFLLEAGADPHMSCSYGQTPMYMAIAQDNYDIVEMMLDKGAALNPTSRAPVLHDAARQGKGDIVRLLISRGADVEATDGYMRTAADVADDYYPKVAAFIRSHLPPKKVPEVIPGWHLTGPEEISHVAEKAAIGCRVTEIFNFHSRIYTHLTRDMKTGAQSESSMGFDDMLDSRLLDDARGELIAQGGTAPETFGVNKQRRAGL